MGKLLEETIKELMDTSNFVRLSKKYDGVEECVYCGASNSYRNGTKLKHTDDCIVTKINEEIDIYLL